MEAVPGGAEKWLELQRCHATVCTLVTFEKLGLETSLGWSVRLPGYPSASEASPGVLGKGGSSLFRARRGFSLHLFGQCSMAWPMWLVPLAASGQLRDSHES